MNQEPHQIDPRYAVIKGAVIGAAATLLLLGAAWLGWRFYSQWRLGRVELTNEGIPLTAEVLPESGKEAIGEPFEIVTRSTLALPDGDYQLRLSGAGRLSATYRLAVNRGEKNDYPISLEDSRLLHEEPRKWLPNQKRVPEQPMLFASTTVPLAIKPGAADVIEWNGRSLVRRDGVTGGVVWDTLRSEKPFDNNRDTAAWLRPFSGFPNAMTIVQPAFDVDGDAVADVVCGFAMVPSLLAVSGKDGSILWTYAADPDGPGKPQPDPPVFAGADPDQRQAQLIGMPALFDCDRDGTLDLIATLVFDESRREVNKRSGRGNSGAVASNRDALSRRVVMAVSGRTGRWIWTHAVDKDFTHVNPYGRYRAATLVRGPRPATVAMLDDSSLLTLDAATGRPVGQPLAIGFVPVRAVQHADLDADGEPEVLALGPGPQDYQRTLAAFASGTGRQLWVQTVMEPYESLYQATAPDWPLVADLDADGRCEIVVADSGLIASAGNYRGVTLLDGASGQPRWVRPMRPDTKAYDRIESIAAAPDLDHDGTRDLVILSRFNGRQPAGKPSAPPEEPESIYCDAISGRDGHPLWWHRFEFDPQRVVGISGPLFWGRGPDGWPLLAVAFSGLSRDRGVVRVLEASTGREVHTVRGMMSASVADLDGDGLADLWGEADGQLVAFRGPMPEAWRALGYYNAAGGDANTSSDRTIHTVDFDGDGIGDALASPVRSPVKNDEAGSRTVVARSGRDGHVLWKTATESPALWGGTTPWTQYYLSTFPMPEGDLDGDGTCDVIVKGQSLDPFAKATRAAKIPLQLLSGRTGRRLWSAGDLALDPATPGHAFVQSVSVCKIDPAGTPSILAVLSTPAPALKPGATPNPSNDLASRLVRLSGRDGRVVWDEFLLDHVLSSPMLGIPEIGLGDLDGDRSLDAALLIQLGNVQENRGLELRAVSLRDGKPIWSRKIPTYHVSARSVVVVGDLDGDNHAEVVTLTQRPSGAIIAENVLEAFDGRDGRSLWIKHGELEDPWRNQWGGWLRLADFDGTRKRRVCLGMTHAGARHRIAIYDAAGRDVAHRDLSKGQIFAMLAADVNNDGRDELVVSTEHRLEVLRGDLQQIWSLPQDIHRAGFVYLPLAGATPTLAIQPPEGLDAANGRPRWAGDARPSPYSVFSISLLDPGSATRLPLLFPAGSRSVCYQALPASPDGKFAEPSGTPVPPGLARDDPRWTRPLPWVGPIERSNALWILLACGGLALLNVVLPLGILRLAAGRRRWSMRVLVALPIAAVVPLMAYLALEPAIATRANPSFASSRLEFLLGTMAGIPAVSYAAIAGWAIVRRRWKALGILAGLTLITSTLFAAVWIGIDSRLMPAIEQYGTLGWYLIVLPGAYASGLLAVFGWGIRAATRLPQRFRSQRVAERNPLPITS